jgi:hypothetical protein
MEHVQLDMGCRSGEQIMQQVYLNKGLVESRTGGISDAAARTTRR